MNDDPALQWTNLFLFFLIFFLLVLSAVFSGSEVALMACQRHVIQGQARRGRRRARLVLELLQQPERLLSTILVGNNLANTGAVSLATYLLLRLTGGHGEVIAYTTFGMTLVLLLFSEISPKSIAAYRPNEWSLIFAPFLYTVMLVLYHPIRLVSALVRGLLRLVGISGPDRQPQMTLEELRSLLMMVRQYRERLDDEFKMMVRISDLPLHTVGEIMIHRDQVRMIEEGTPFEVIERIIFETGFSRFPVFHDSPDNVLGVLYVKDYFRAKLHQQLNDWKDLEALLREPIRCMTGTRIDQVLKLMREQKVHIALVYDEFGGFEGIVTLEDILEEIVGEIEDEFDTRAVERIRRTPRGLEVWAQVPIKELNEYLPEPIPESADYTTLAGFLIKQRDGIPESNEAVLYGPYRFIVRRKEGHRLLWVEIVFEQTEQTSASA